jgi:hypothetical protein
MCAAYRPDASRCAFRPSWELFALCGSAAIAKGLCGKHYMRQRQHGDATKTLRTGSKPDKQSTEIGPGLAQAVAINRALQGLGAAGYIEEGASRRDGTVNFAKLIRIMETRLWDHQRPRLIAASARDKKEETIQMMIRNNTRKWWSAG